MSLNKLPEELYCEILKNLDCQEIYNFSRCFYIPKSIINLPIYKDKLTILECVFNIDVCLDNKELIAKLVKEGADPKKVFHILKAFFELEFYKEEKFCEIYNIMFPNILSFTRSGKCYQSYDTIIEYHNLKNLIN